jgi:mannose-1-phosphate guanylyltransferase/mannose-6-phosphate isomerase
MKITPIILSGGSGTRLWPLSRSSNPKQFLDFFDNNSLFSKTILRASDETIFNPLITICNNEHRFLVASELQKNNIKAQSIILEPIAKNTAAAIAIAALDVIKNNSKNDDLMLVLPSDHLIKEEQKFKDYILATKEVAIANYLVTFGITPDSPQTGYGYIKRGRKLNNFNNVFEVEKFIEKPDKKKAQNFLNQGGFLFNSGIFMFKASVYLNNLENLQNEVFTACKNAYQNSIKDLDFIRLNAEDFTLSPNISIDYAIMEKASKIAVIPIDIGWSDVGDWNKIAEITPKDQNQNSLIGNVEILETKNCYINSQSSIIAAIGVKNLIIISLKDVVLVLNKNSAQAVKKLFQILKAKKKEECDFNPKVLRPWGSFEAIDYGGQFKVKKIIVNPKAALSLQMHYHRAEHWVVVKGIANVTCGNQKIILNESESTYIPIGKKHRLENKQQIPLEIIEVQTGNYLKEDDIIRFDDNYGR